MTAWYVQKLYQGDEYQYYVLPYDLLQTVMILMNMKNGIKQTIKFLMNSHLSENTAQKFYEKRIKKRDGRVN